MSSNNEFPLTVVNPKTTDVIVITEEDWKHYRELSDNLIHKKTVEHIENLIKQPIIHPGWIETNKSDWEE